MGWTLGKSGAVGISLGTSLETSLGLIPSSRLGSWLLALGIIDDVMRCCQDGLVPAGMIVTLPYKVQLVHLVQEPRRQGLLDQSDSSLVCQ